MLCPNCSTENTEDAKFCMACGEPLAAEVARPPVAAPAPPVAAPVPPVSAPAPPVATVPPAPPTDGRSGSNPWLPDQPTAEAQSAPPGADPILDVPTPATGEPPATTPGGPPSRPGSPEPGPPDPHGLDGQLARMSDATRPHAELPLLLASLLLTGSEAVTVVVPGLIDDIVGVAVVTDQRVLLVNGRRWNPAAYEFRIGPGLVVEGWQDADTAMLTFVAEESVRISAIVDKPLAFEAARVIRERVAMLE
jgi:hypothetical protein